MTEDEQLDVPAFMSTLQSLVIEDNLATITEAEEWFQEQALKMYGFVALSRAFQSFFVETIHVGRTATPAAPTRTFMWLAPRMNICFQIICAAERSAMRGYPVPAFAQLRNVFDTAVVSSAVAQGVATCDEAEGIEPGKAFDPAEVLRARKQTERLIFAQMLGLKSGLSQVTREQLGKLDKLFELRKRTANACPAFKRWIG